MASSTRLEALLPAPGRGQYDRAQTRERRQAEQRERLLVATAAAFARQHRGVSAVVELAGVGRNTFYEYFDDFTHAVEAVSARARARLELACQRAPERARTPIEKLRAITHGWCTALMDVPDEACVLLCAEERSAEQPLSVAGRALAAAFENARPGGARGAERDPAPILAAAAAAEALLLRALAARSAPDATAAEMARTAIRLLH